MESQILKALQPKLHLDPTPKLDRLCKNPVPTKVINFDADFKFFTQRTDIIYFCTKIAARFGSLQFAEKEIKADTRSYRHI